MSSTRQFTINNDGPGRVIVSGVSLVQTGNKFSLSGVPDLPLIMNLGDSFEVSVTAMSDELGAASSTLRVESSASNTPTDKSLSANFVDPFSPIQLAGLQFWWDASQLEGYLSGQSVNDWPDLTSGKLLSRSVESRRPTFQTNVQNGLPSVRFLKTSIQSLGGSSSESINVQSVFLTARVNTANFTNSFSQPMSLFGFNSSGQFSFFGIEGTSRIDLSEFGPVGDPSLLYMDGVIQPTGEFGNLTSHIYQQNRSSAFTSQVNSIHMAVVNDSNQAGAQSMDMYEVFGFNRILNETELGQVMEYLSEKWGIPVS